MSWLQKLANDIYQFGPHLEQQQEEERLHRNTDESNRLLGIYHEWKSSTDEYGRIMRLNFLEKQLVDVKAARRRYMKANKAWLTLSTTAREFMRGKMNG